MTKILLADDSVTIQKVVDLTFSDEESQVVAVSDGASALEKAQLDRPDIIISDVIMPGMSGYEFCQKIKSDPGLKNIPFLFLKGTFESFDEEKARQCGADGFIVKPFDSQDLIDKVRELVEKAEAGPAPPVEPAPAPVEAAPSPTAAESHAPIVSEAPPPPEPVFAEEPLPQTAAVEETIDLGEEVEVGPPEIAEDQEDDLWSEVSLRDTAAPLMEDTVLEEESFWGTGEGERSPDAAVEAASPAGEALLEEIGEPEILDLADDEGLAPDLIPSGGEEEETPFGLMEEKEVAEPAEGSAPPVGTVEKAHTAVSEPLPAEEIREEPPRSEPEAPSAAPVPTGIEMERVISEKIDEAVKSILGPAIGETARKIIEEVAWEVIPDLAEAMIKSEIERIKQDTGS